MYACACVCKYVCVRARVCVRTCECVCVRERYYGRIWGVGKRERETDRYR